MAKRVASLKQRLYWGPGHSPLDLKKDIDELFAKRFPAIINRTQEMVADRVLARLKRLHREAFPEKTSKTASISYNSILKLKDRSNIEIIPGTISQGYSYHIGYYPNFFSSAKQLAPKHGVQDYIMIQNDGIDPGAMKIMSPPGWHRIYIWAQQMGIAQDRRAHMLEVQRKRSDGRVGRPTNYRVMANPKQQLWAIVKHMQKKGIKRTSHLFKFATYVKSGLRSELNFFYGKAKQEIYDAANKLKTAR